MKVYAENFRGFSTIQIDLSKLTILLGDNSSGKSSILHLIDSVVRSGLNYAPKMNEDLGVSEYDYFSPYFSNADVTFGFFDENGVKRFGKLVTVRRISDGAPIVTRCSYLIDETVVTLQRKGKSGYTRIKSDFTTKNTVEVMSYHNSNDGFSRVTETIKGFSLADPSILFYLDVPKKLGGSRFVERLLQIEPTGARLVSPIRALPEKFYSSSRKISALGLHFATMWHDFSQAKAGRAFEAAEKFGRESNLFEKINVRKISKRVQNSPLLVSVEKSGKEFLLNQVGVGVSQVVPILVETVYAVSSKPKLSILLQQPELHLHPVAQAALGTYIFKMAVGGLRGVIETHSSYLLDRLRAEVRDSFDPNADKSGSFGSSDVHILFCVNNDSGNVAYPIELQRDGKLYGEPDSFHAFFVDELMRTMF
ncbi:MAG: AAA family ATPase [Rhodobacter sp.]|nr:AAA family ATPase [Rhodobacter sp.]